jgi:hypothetical protein
LGIASGEGLRSFQVVGRQSPDDSSKDHSCQIVWHIFVIEPGTADHGVERVISAAPGMESRDL